MHTPNQPSPIIFISHRKTDAAFADILRDFFLKLGVPNDYIFCSSLPGNDVKRMIFEEVRANIMNSRLNIAILSADYYDSAYCLNEAGIIWLHHQTPAILIALPEISTDNMSGFVDSNNILRRLDNPHDIAAIWDIAKDVLGVNDVTAALYIKESQEVIRQYSALLEARPPISAATAPAAPTLTGDDAERKRLCQDLLHQITTDDERIVLYYMIDQELQVLHSDLFRRWINQKYLRLDEKKAFQLLSQLEGEYFKYEYEDSLLFVAQLSMSLPAFRACTANRDDVLNSLKPALERRLKFGTYQ